MVSSEAGDALTPDEGTSCDLENTYFECSKIPVKGSVYCVPSSRYGQVFKIPVDQMYRELIRDLEGELEHLVENNHLQIDLAFIETEALNHCGLNPGNNSVKKLAILSSCILDTKKTVETNKVSILKVTKTLLEILFCLFGRHAFQLDCSICRNYTISTRSTASCFRSICKEDWNFRWLVLSTHLLSPLRGTTMEVRCNSHPEENSGDWENLLNLLMKKLSFMQEPLSTLCHRLGCRIPSVTMTTDAVKSPQLRDCLYSSSQENSTLLPLSDGYARQPCLIQIRKTLHEVHHPMQNTITNYNRFKSNLNHCISTRCQSSSHNQSSRSGTVVSVNSSHQRIRKSRNIRRSNSSNYVSYSSGNVISYNNRTIGSNTKSSLICCRSMPVFEGSSCLPSPSHTTETTASQLQPRRWSLSSPSPRSRTWLPSEGVLTSNWSNASRTQQSPSADEHSDDTSLFSSSLTSLYCPSERLTQRNCSRRRRARSHRRQIQSTRPSDHSTDHTLTVLEFWRDGGQLGLESLSANRTTKTADIAPTSLTSLFPVSHTGSDHCRKESGSYIRVSMNSSVTSTEDSSTPGSGSVPPSLPRQQAPLPPFGKLHRTSSASASPDASLLMSTVDSNAPHLWQTQYISTVEQEEMESRHSPMRHRSICKRSRRIHPLLGLWNLLTQSTSSSSANRRDGTTSVKMLSQVWTCLLSLMLVVTVLPNVAECCSSRSTPRPRPSSPTLRPNITFQTYACPPAYAAWYCLNGATCFTVKIGESILYNCECAEGYMGQRCEFKDLDGSYLPTREKVLLETASIAGGATVVIVLVFFVIFSVFLVKNREKETRDLEGFSRINININSGAASSWPASGASGHQSPSYSQRTSHSFVTSPTGAVATSPHTTTISLPPLHVQPDQGCNHHHHDPQHGCQVASVPIESVVDGKRFVSEMGVGGDGSTVVDGGMKGRCTTPTAASTVPAGEAFYGVPARVVRTVTTITDLASIYTNPRQEIHQVEVLQQVNVLKVDQSKACYNATFVRPSSNACTTALFRGPMWQEASYRPDDKMSSAPLSWQSFKATSWLSSSSPSKTQDRLSVMPQRKTAANDQAALDMVPHPSLVVVPFREQRTKMAHGAVTLAMTSHAAELDGREQLQHSSTTQILANSKMPFDLNSELNSRLSVDETNASFTVYISDNDCSAKDEQKANDISATDCAANDFTSSECSRASGAVNHAFDSGEEDVVNQPYSGAHDCDNGPRVGHGIPQPLFDAKNTEKY